MSHFSYVGALLGDRSEVQYDGVRAIGSAWVGNSSSLELVDVRTPHPDTPAELLAAARASIDWEVENYGEVAR